MVVKRRYDEKKEPIKKHKKVGNLCRKWNVNYDISESNYQESPEVPAGI